MVLVNDFCKTPAGGRRRNWVAKKRNNGNMNLYRELDNVTRIDEQWGNKLQMRGYKRSTNTTEKVQRKGGEGVEAMGKSTAENMGH